MMRDAQARTGRRGNLPPHAAGIAAHGNRLASRGVTNGCSKRNVKQASV